jgi:hypothetical protein
MFQYSIEILFNGLEITFFYYLEFHAKGVNKKSNRIFRLFFLFRPEIFSWIQYNYLEPYILNDIISLFAVMDFALVRFLIDDQREIIPTSWFKDRNHKSAMRVAFWPNGIEPSQVERLVEQSPPPGKGWPDYKVKVISMYSMFHKIQYVHPYFDYAHF